MIGVASVVEEERLGASCFVGNVLAQELFGFCVIRRAGFREDVLGAIDFGAAKRRGDFISNQPALILRGRMAARGSVKEIEPMIDRAVSDSFG